MNSEYEQWEHEKHIRELPDTYIGSSNPEEKELYIYKDNKISKQNVIWVPGLFKIFDEIIVNAIDNHTRTKREKEKGSKRLIKMVSKLEVDINKETGLISVLNDGEGIEVKKMDTDKKKDIYVIELIFGELLTSENYKGKGEKKLTGGKNGYGAKLTNIFSKTFTVESVDRKKKLLYSQTWKDNMRVKEIPIITKYDGEPYTKITFLPDYERFSQNGLTEDMYSIFSKRVYDCALWFSGNMKIELKTPLKTKDVSPVNVYFNGEEIECSLLNYISKYTNNELEEKDILIETFNRWEVGIVLSKNHKYMQNSLVNGISTTRGGRHVDNILNQMLKKLIDVAATKKKKIEVKSSYLKENIWLFVKCIIEEPVFDGQTKEYMTTNIQNFGSKCEITDKFIDKLLKMGLMERIINSIEMENNKLGKKTDGTKRGSIRGIKKLDDANLAGTSQSDKCTLILTEGDSAKASAVCGLAVVGRDHYGVFPLKGKILNVRDQTEKRIYENEEISNLKKIIGLESDKEYMDTKSLRYGKIMIMTDQDYDGFHIKGLLMNLISCKWPSLLNKDFIKCIVTPIVKVSKGNETLQFYNLSDYNTWKDNKQEGNWKTKYYKGLGTSNRKESQEYFKNMLTITYETDEDTKKSLEKSFSKDFTNERKVWLKHYDSSDVLSVVEGDNRFTYSEFVDKELIHFSNADNLRSIPDLMDGLKPSQRKVLFAAFCKKLKNDIKVSQFSGYVSERSSYHHGEASLNGTIINMAQNFPGSNNIELLYPSGQFGTRIQNGKDSASCRYIFTRLSNLTDKIVNPKDNANLKYLDDDGFSIEPERYYPILPMILVNGTNGIGTGWSSDVPQYNPMDLVSNLRKLIEGKEMEEIHPWARNYLGSFHKVDSKTYIVLGKYAFINNNTIRILELPLGVSIESYKEFLDKAVSGNDPKIDWIVNYEDYSSDIYPCFAVLCKPGKLAKLVLEQEPDEFGCNKIHRELKLVKNVSLNNMVLYNSNFVLTRYESVLDIITEYYGVRLVYYAKRKESLLKDLYHKKLVYENKIRFIQEQIDDILVLYKKKKDIIIQQLEKTEYAKICKGDSNIPSYEYLLSMRMDTVTEEKMDELKNDLEGVNSSISDLENKTPKDLWSIDLDEFVKSYNEYYSKLEKAEDLSEIKISSTLKTKVSKTTAKKSKGKGGRGSKSTGTTGRGRGNSKK